MSEVIKVAQISTTCTSPAGDLEKEKNKQTDKQTNNINKQTNKQEIKWPKYRLPVHHQLETWRKKTIKAT